MAVQGQVAGRCCRGPKDTAAVELHHLHCSRFFSAFIHGCLGCELWGVLLWVELSHSHLTTDGQMNRLEQENTKLGVHMSASPEGHGFLVFLVWCWFLL